MATQLRPALGAVKSVKRIGRGQGSGHGRFSTRGMNGAASRSGYKRKVGFEGGQITLARRLPKFGFNSPFRTEYEEVNVSRLQEAIDSGLIVKNEVVTPELLLSTGVVSRSYNPVKILGNGDISVALTIKVQKVSKGAQQKIEKAGGKVEAYA
jgi:large subunit ribosomal protein L15